MEMGRKLKSKLQSSLGMTAEVEVQSDWRNQRRNMVAVIASAVPFQLLFLPVHTHTHFLSPGMVTSWGGAGGSHFPEAPGGVGVPRRGQQGRVDHTSEREGRRQGGKETSKPGRNNTDSRPRDSIF